MTERATLCSLRHRDGTATQPAVTRLAGLKAPEALDGLGEIIPEGRNLFGPSVARACRTVRHLSDEQLIDALEQVKHGLVIVNTRRHARELFELLQRSGLAGHVI
jgi:CRISPR-associated endonuclease/helicase Cas3